MYNVRGIFLASLEMLGFNKMEIDDKHFFIISLEMMGFSKTERDISVSADIYNSPKYSKTFSVLVYNKPEDPKPVTFMEYPPQGITYSKDLNYKEALTYLHKSLKCSTKEKNAQNVKKDSC